MTSAQTAQFLVDKRWPLFIFSFLILFIAGYGMGGLGFESNYKIFFSPDDPQLLAHEKMEDTYTKSDNVAFAIGLKDGVGGDLFNNKHLDAVEALTAEMWKFPYVVRVDSISTYQYSEAAGFDLKVYPLFTDSINMPMEEIQRRKEIALKEEGVVRALLAEDARALLVNARILMPEDTQSKDAATMEVVEKAREIRQRIIEKYPNLEVHLLGSSVVDAAFNESSLEDMQTLVPLMFVVILLLCGLLLRSIVAVLALVLLIFMSVPAALGSVGWFGLALNQISVTAPMIILTLCVCDGIHILASQIQYQRQGASVAEARLKALEVNMQPVLLTSITTAIGFLSLNFSDSPPFRHWGTIVAIGVMFAWFFSLTMLPVLMGAIRVTASANQDSDKKRFLDHMADWVISKRNPLFWGGLVLALILAAGLPRNELTDGSYSYFDHGVPMRDAATFVEERISGFDNVAFSLPAAEGADGITNPEYLKQLEAFAAWAAKQPDVVHVDSFSTVVKRLNRSLNEDDPAFYSIPDERPLAVEAIMLFEMSLPYGMDLNNQINFDKSATRFNITLKGVQAKRIVEFEQQARDWLETNAPSMNAPGGSVSLMFAHIGQNNIKSMITGSIVALFGISLTLIIALRSWRLGALSLIPNTLPAAITFGAWGYFVGEINLAAAAVFSTTLGIVVDDTVHFISKFLRAQREQGLSAEQAVRYAFNNVGLALLVTTTALAIGFAVLALSSFKVNELTGLLTAITITVALAYDLLFLPPLLIKLAGWLKLEAKPEAA